MKQSNNIPQGYKDSPLGIIPVEWEVKKLGEILQQGKLGGNYENSEADMGIPVIKMGNIQRGNISIDKIQYLPQDEQYNLDDILIKGDLLFNTRNTLDLVGKVAIWNNELPLAVYNSNLMRMKFDEKYIFSNYYMNYSFNSHCLLSQLRGIATGTTSVAAIYGRDLEKIKFALPPLPEQQKIAEILSTWDKAIEKQTQLIDKLENRKHALMQQLLTGKKRLKGFSGEWREVRLGEMAEIRKGRALTSNEISDGIYPVIAGGKTSPYNHSEYTDENVITVSASGAYAGYVAYHKNKIWASDCSVIYGETQIADIIYLYYLLAFNQEFIYSLQSGGAQPHIFPKDIAAIRYIFPPIGEQTAIASILSTADKEISFAQKKLAKMNSQKKGLMQVLLTGKRRVEKRK
jgi:type I restriction enzyme S subunit